MLGVLCVFYLLFAIFFVRVFTCFLPSFCMFFNGVLLHCSHVILLLSLLNSFAVNSHMNVYMKQREVTISAVGMGGSSVVRDTSI